MSNDKKDESPHGQPAKPNQPGSNGGHGGGKPETYIFFVDKERFETDERVLTAAQIKARVTGVEPGDKLSLEGKGDEPDRLLNDEEEIDLSKDRGPLRFIVVPSASFGA